MELNDINKNTSFTGLSTLCAQVNDYTVFLGMVIGFLVTVYTLKE